MLYFVLYSVTLFTTISALEVRDRKYSKIKGKLSWAVKGSESSGRAEQDKVLKQYDHSV